MRALILIPAMFLVFQSLDAQRMYKQSVRLMGCDFEITISAADKDKADNWIESAIDEIRRIEDLISSWEPESQTSAINRNAGVAPVQVDKELFDLIERSLGISKIVDGAFDITYASMDRIWRFDGSLSTMPEPEQVRESVEKVGYKKVVLDREAMTVFLAQRGMKIGFGAIGKGYAADRALELLKDHGVNSGIINASGDLSVWGRKPDGSSWDVAITNPKDRMKSFGVVEINNGSVVTSGDYEKYVIIDGKRYGHIIDPRTGYPSQGITSVTVFAPKGELADAMATAIFVMGKDAGMDRVEQLPMLECVLIDDNGQLFTSSGIEIKNYEK